MIYLVSFDPHKVDANGLHETIKNSELITDWWHYLGSTYLVSSTAPTAKKLQLDIQKKWSAQRFLVVEVNLPNSEGWLPEKAWEWIRKHS